MLYVTLDSDSKNYPPCQKVSGRVGWNLSQAPESAMLRLVWYTKATAGLDLGERMPGAINQDGLEPTDPWEDVILDVGVAAESAIAPSGPRQEEFFELTLPDGPYSFLSDAFSIHWTVELEVNGGEVAERLDIVVSPWGTVVDARRKAEESEEALGTA